MYNPTCHHASCKFTSEYTTDKPGHVHNSAQDNSLRQPQAIHQPSRNIQPAINAKRPRGNTATSTASCKKPLIKPLCRLRLHLGILRRPGMQATTFRAIKAQECGILRRRRLPNKTNDHAVAAVERGGSLPECKVVIAGSGMEGDEEFSSSEAADTCVHCSSIS